MMRMSSSKLNVRSDGIEKAFDLANAAKQKMTSMHHTLFDFLRMKEDSAGVRVPATCHLHAALPLVDETVSQQQALLPSSHRTPFACSSRRCASC